MRGGAPVCEAGERRCLRQVPGWVTSRSAGAKDFRVEWVLHPVRAGLPGGRANTSVTESDALHVYEYGRPVTGLFWEDELVAFRLPDGRRVSTDSYGYRSLVTPGLVALALLSAVVAVLIVVRARRRAAGAWWATMSPPARRPPPDAMQFVAAFLLFPATAAFVVHQFAGGWTATALGYLAGALVVGWRARRHHVRQRGPGPWVPEADAPQQPWQHAVSREGPGGRRTGPRSS